MAKSNNAVSTVPPTAGYVGISKLSFVPINPNALGVANPTPVNTLGNTAQSLFSKLHGGKPVGKIVIGTQQARL